MQLSVNGIETFVANGGQEFDRSRPTIVLLHGAGFDHTTWALHSRWFAHHGYGVLAPDLPGHGRSSGAPLRTIGDMADWTAALLQAAAAAATTRARMMVRMIASRLCRFACCPKLPRRPIAPAQLGFMPRFLKAARPPARR